MPLLSQLQDIINSLGGFWPELWLSIAFCSILIAELILIRLKIPQARLWLSSLTIAFLLIAGFLVIQSTRQGFLFLHLLFSDDQAAFYKLIVLLAAILVIGYDQLTDAPDRKDRLPAEWYPLLLATVLGSCLLAMSVNLLSIYLSLELISICSYLLTALTKTRKAVEGGIKYLLFGAISSAIMLYGMSLLYGITGTLDITSPAFGIELAKNEPLVVAAIGLLTMSGFLFKLSLVPFHVWTPDVYDAAPVPVAAYFSIAPKAATVLVLMRTVTALPDAALGFDVQSPLAIVAIASITLGNFSALWQTDAKRLLAYSGIAQAGFLIAGIVALNKTGFEATTFYMATYLFINLAAFFLIDLLSRQHNGHLAIAGLAGLGARQPLLSIALTVVMIALVGLPPTVGFTAKLLVFSALYEAFQASGNKWLGILFGWGLLNAVISLAYYLKIPFLLFFRPSPSEDTPLVVVSPVATGLAVGLALLSVWFFLKPESLLQWIARF